MINVEAHFDIENFTISKDAKINEAISRLNLKSQPACLVVVGKDMTLIGTISMGDIKRYSNQIIYSSTVYEACNKKPIFLNEKDNIENIINRVKALGINLVPKISKENQLLSVLKINYLKSEFKGNKYAAVIMAGGEGKRLRNVIGNLPKPLLNFGGESIIDIQIRKLVNHGFNEIYISVNYLAESIMKHLGEGEQFGVKIKYLQEDYPLGTAGSLSLIGKTEYNKFLVINADLISDLSYAELIESHELNNAEFTLVVNRILQRNNFGVVENNHGTWSISEKPTREMLIFSGITVINLSLFESIKQGENISMTDFFNRISLTSRISLFYNSSFWFDIGTPETLNQAKKEILS